MTDKDEMPENLWVTPKPYLQGYEFKEPECVAQYALVEVNTTTSREPSKAFGCGVCEEPLGTTTNCVACMNYMQTGEDVYGRHAGNEKGDIEALEALSIIKGLTFGGLGATDDRETFALFDTIKAALSAETVDVEGLKKTRSPWADGDHDNDIYISGKKDGWNDCLDHQAENYDFVRKK